MNKKILIATSTIIIAGGVGLSYFGGLGGLQSSFFGETLSIVDEPVCGNSILEAREDSSIVEQCDDGNTDNWDNCSSFCQLEQGGGCLNPSGTNYNPDAVYDDGSCNYPIPERAWNHLQKQTFTIPMASNR
jgi:cysteine-rich repeat protein